MKNREKIGVGLIILLTIILTFFFGVRKINYHCDEIWTYGLSNNQGDINPSFDTGVEYSGMGPFESFTEVLDGERFTYSNVWENQAKDVHPPFYYLLVHTVCSVFKGTFSKWYGISINLFWMIFIEILLYKLSKKITGNVVASFGITLSYGISVLFLDTLLLIRMYTQLTFFFIILAYVFKCYWNKELDRYFYIEISLISIFGMLTQYYFLMYIFAMCILFVIQLGRKKRWTELKKFIIDIILSGFIYGCVWYHILAHIFNGYRGTEAISKAFSLGGLLSGFVGFLELINDELFAGIMLLFVLIGAFFLFLKIKNKEIDLTFELSLFLAAVFYMLVVAKIAPMITHRYIMPIGWIIILESFLAVSGMLKMLVPKQKNDLIISIIFVVISVVNIIIHEGYITMDYYNSRFVNALEETNGKEAVVFIDKSWKLLYDFVILQKADKYILVDEDNIYEIMNAQTEDYLFIINLDEDTDQFVEQLDCELLYDDGTNFYYLVNVK